MFARFGNSARRVGDFAVRKPIAIPPSRPLLEVLNDFQSAARTACHATRAERKASELRHRPSGGAGPTLYRGLDGAGPSLGAAAKAHMGVVTPEPERFTEGIRNEAAGVPEDVRVLGVITLEDVVERMVPHACMAGNS